MRKLILLLTIPAFLFSCGDAKEKEKEKIVEPTDAPAPAVTTSSEDKVMIEWLQGKEWKAESDAAPMSMLKLQADGTCEYATGKDPWTVTGGSFALGKYAGTKWPLKKTGDDSFTLFVEPTNATYVYKFVKNL